MFYLSEGQSHILFVKGNFLKSQPSLVILYITELAELFNKSEKKIKI